MELYDVAESGEESEDEMSERPQQVKIIKETKTINNFKVFHKVNWKQLRALKRKSSEFMASGRTEFQKQLSHWKELFEETADDY